MPLFILVLAASFVPAQAGISNLVTDCLLQPLDADNLTYIMCMPMKEKVLGWGDIVKASVWLDPEGPWEWSVSLLSATYQPVFQAHLNGRIIKLRSNPEPWGPNDRKWKEQAGIISKLPREGKVWIHITNNPKGLDIELGHDSATDHRWRFSHVVDNSETDYKFLSVVKPSPNSQFTVMSFAEQRLGYIAAGLTDKLFNLLG